MTYSNRFLRVLCALAVLSLCLPAATALRPAEAYPPLPSPAAPAAAPPGVPFADLTLDAPPAVPRATLQLALAAISCAVASRTIAPPPTLTLIDYSRPSVEPRLWVFDLANGALLFEELVAHGRNTGDNLSEHFSDEPDSRQSSIGLFVARETYTGSNGYSLRLDGLEPGFNGRARERAIVMHGAPYVSAAIAARQGRLGRSWGCPAVREAVARDVIDTVQDGGVVFSYYPDETWLRSSRFLNCGLPSRTDASAPIPPRRA